MKDKATLVGFASMGIVALLIAGSLSAQQRPITAVDYYRLYTVSDPAISPGGSHVAFTVTTVVEDKDRRHREVWIAGTADSSRYRLTSPTTEASEPVWSPDGSLIGFSSKRDGEKEDEDAVWFLRTTSMAGEAFRITGVHGAPVWSPDGKWIAYTWAGAEPDSIKKETRRGWVARNAITKGADPKRFDGRVITHIPYKADERGFLRDPESVPPKHIYVVAAAGVDPRQITSGTLNDTDISWSPDGRSIAFVRDSSDADELRSDTHEDVFSVDVASGQIQRLTSSTGPDRSPGYSPDGKTVSYLCSAGRGEPVDVCTTGSNGGGVKNLTQAWSLDPRAPRWSPDGQAISFWAETEGNTHLFRVPADGGPVRQVTAGPRQLAGFSASADGRRLAYVGTDVTHPSELFVSASDGTGERRLTSFNDAFLASTAVIAADTLWYPSVGGLRIQGWLMKPFGFQAGKKFPLALYIHGGPHSQYGNVYFHEFQMLAGQGYWVLFTNPRGSTGYGHEFTYASRARWGMEDYQDLMKGVDEVIRRTGQVDTARLAVLGGSYGGFMTNWILGHTNRFAVAQTDRSILNWFSWYGLSDSQGLTEYEFLGTPWERDSLYWELSPLKYARNIRTPLLIVHSEEDYRVPITDGEQLFMILKKRGVPTEFVRYPRSSHGLSRTGPPWLLVDRLERIRTWLEHWIGTGSTPPRVSAVGGGR